MGNYFTNFRKNKVEPQDSQRLMLFDDIEEKIDKLQESMDSKYTRIINMYNLEISNMKQEINQLTKNNDDIINKVNNLRFSIDEKENKISQIEYKLINMESGDQFLSTVEVDSQEPSLME